ncbi:MAG: divalent metal cation transporter [Verrucomicrobiota bacterium]|nr:divalent metal cation transporter [Verrucomicrobiota bacterium]
MSQDKNDQDSMSAEIAELEEVNHQPFTQRIGYYTKKSGPGWLQGAITLGGGSLAGALYLGVFMGYNMMWLQPLAMILGVIMLSAISYVTLSTGERPFQAIKTHVSPVLAWAWIIATLMANVVWCMPQFALGTAAIQQNLMDGEASSTASTVTICVGLLIVGLVINYFYESGNKGIKLFEIVLKILVGIVVLSFFGVAVALATSGALDYTSLFAGFIPNPSMLGAPAPTFADAIAATGEFANFWSKEITSSQRDVMMTAFGTAVGINMTFLLPYSMLKKKWGKSHRSLAIFDLSIGLIVPFVLATACVVIAAASQFHAQFGDVLNEDGTVIESMSGAFADQANKRVAFEQGEAFATMSNEEKAAARDALPTADRQLAAMLAKRDNMNLAQSLEPLTGPRVAQDVFGIGVLGMAVSTIIILMLINGFTLCEMLSKPGHKGIHLLGTLIAGLGGFLGPLYFWANASSKAALAIPTSIIGGAMIPIAYFTFLLLMNSKSLLGEKGPQGGHKLKWNTLMMIATVIATAGSIWVLLGKGTPGKVGIGILAALFVLGLTGFLAKSKNKAEG